MIPAVKKVIRFLLLASACLLSSCALPVPEGKELGSFVPEKEITSVTLVREGMGYYNSNKFMEAEGSFRQALYLNPDLSNLKVNLAATLEKQGQYEEALALYENVLKKDQLSVPVLTGIGRLKLADKDYSKAISDMSQALFAATVKGDIFSQVSLLRTLATLSFRVGRVDEALCLSAADISLGKDRTSILEHNELLLSAGKFADSLGFLESSASELGLGEDPGILHHRALAAYGLKNYQDAYDLERRAAFTEKPDEALKPDMLIVKVLSEWRTEEEKGARQGKTLADTKESLSEKTAEAVITFSESLLESGSKALLYWPPNLLEDLKQFVAAPVIQDKL